MDSLLEQVKEHAGALPGRVLKAVFMEWLATTPVDGDLTALAEALNGRRQQWEQGAEAPRHDENSHHKEALAADALQAGRHRTLQECADALPDDAFKAVFTNWAATTPSGGLAALEQALNDRRVQLEQDPDPAYEAYLQQEGRIGFNALEEGRFCTESLDDLKARVLAKHGHAPVASKR